MSDMVQTIAGGSARVPSPTGLGAYEEAVWHFVGAHPSGRWARK
jgi:hypothetical protein